MKEIRIVNMEMNCYKAIMNKTKDANSDLCYWDYPIEELGYLMESLLDECDYDVRYLALIDNRLYELPEDWKEIM